MSAEKKKTTPLGKSEGAEPERFIPDGMGMFQRNVKQRGEYDQGQKRQRTIPYTFYITLEHTHPIRDESLRFRSLTFSEWCPLRIARSARTPANIS